jgi:hypothetical protein
MTNAASTATPSANHDTEARCASMCQLSRQGDVDYIALLLSNAHVQQTPHILGDNPPAQKLPNDRHMRLKVLRH